MKHIFLDTYKLMREKKMTRNSQEGFTKAKSFGFSKSYGFIMVKWPYSFP